MPRSHRRHRQDKTVLSRRRCELNWRQVKTVGDWKFRNSFVQSPSAVWTESCHILTQFPIRNVLTYCDVIFGKWKLVHKCVHTADEIGQNCSVSNILRTTENCLRLSPTQFTLHTDDADETRQLSASAVWTRHKSFTQHTDVRAATIK